MFTNQKDYVTKHMQITKFSSEDLDVINVYRSSKGNTVELLDKLLEMVIPGRSILITGDFNICYMNIPNIEQATAC